MIRLSLLGVGLLWVLLVSGGDGADSTAVPAAPGEDTLEITYLANEGFLVRTPDGNLLIDAFLRQAYAGYPALTSEAHARMVAAQAPFDQVDLALVSHVHGDHFQPDSAAAFLKASGSTRLITSPQVLSPRNKSSS